MANNIKVIPVSLRQDPMLKTKNRVLEHFAGAMDGNIEGNGSMANNMVRVY